VDLAALVRTAAAEQAHAGTHRFVVDGPETLPVRIDPIRFLQVVTNLLVNACRFSPLDTLVTVTLDRDADAATRLSVTDHGVGVPAEQREQIFLRFYQVDNTSRRRAGGTGLGLAIARAIVCDGHGGRIYVQPNAGPGTTFVVELPMLPAAVAAGSLVS
jgi:signal transduction histidine kinase